MDKEKSNINIGTILNINNKYATNLGKCYQMKLKKYATNLGKCFQMKLKKINGPVHVVEEYLDKMTEEERKEYFKKMGFTIDEEPQKQLKKEYPKK